MKTKFTFCFAICLMLASEGNAQALFDDFNDGVLNSNYWNTYTDPWASSVAESSDAAHFVNGAGLITKSNYSICSIQGRFQLTGWNYDRMKFVLRSDGTTFDSNWRNIASGVQIQFTATSNPDYGTTNIIVTDLSTSTDLGRAAIPISMGQYYDFLIQDSGTQVEVFLGDLTNSLLTISVTNDYGDKIGVFNREFVGASSAIYTADLDYIQISNAPVPPQDPLTNGLVAYYPFDGNANDQSGNGNNGTVISATLTVDRFGNANSAYAFDGISSLISVPDSPSLRISNDITVVCWLNFSETNMNVRLLGKGVQCGKNYGLWYASWAPYWMFQQFPPQGGCIGCQENTASATPAMVPGRWYQMVGVRSGGFSRLYVDGILLGDDDGHPENCSATTYTGSEPLLIGGNDPAELPTDPPLTLMHGNLDDIRIYDRGLSSNEVARLFAIESALKPGLRLATSIANQTARLDYTNLVFGANYQLQVSSDLGTWTNLGATLTATSSTNSQYLDMEIGNTFFRLTVP